eukprot:356724-Chlamydomonas_euryale.AAC.2
MNAAGVDTALHLPLGDPFYCVLFVALADVPKTHSHTLVLRVTHAVAPRSVPILSWRVCYKCKQAAPLGADL